MEKTFAFIVNNVVENCIVAESKEQAENVQPGTYIEYFLVEPGWTYTDGIFSPPSE